MNRRNFLLSGVALLGPRTSFAATAQIEILPEEPIGTISPDIYGHFTEHLGGCIYDGIWVGENSKIPNIGGIRRALVENLKRVRPPVIRWPGGCFADSYQLARRRRSAEPTGSSYEFLGEYTVSLESAGWSAEIRAESIRHKRVCSVLQIGWRAAVLRGERA